MMGSPLFVTPTDNPGLRHAHKNISDAAKKVFDVKSAADMSVEQMRKMYDYILDRGIQPVTPLIDKPKNDYIDILDVLETAYQYTISISNSYHETASICLKENCYTTFTFVQWYIKDQIKEEAKFGDLIGQYNLLIKNGVTGVALMQFDKILKHSK